MTSSSSSSSDPNEISVSSPADFHVHLRSGLMSQLITPHVSLGGMHLAYVMPNLIPPLTQVDQVMEYRQSLQALAPQTNFLFTLYLSTQLSPDEIRKAKKNGIKGVKSYPRGVTTNSEGGIESYETYYHVFEAMQQEGLVLNLHGEVPSDEDKNITVLNAEHHFLSHLHSIHARFPKLRIVLEHATTSKAVEAVKQCGDTVACTITPHHLDLTVDDWAGKPLGFCKPVAKTWEDRRALREVIKSGHPRFFLGSDSAPHPLSSKFPSPSPTVLTSKDQDSHSHASKSSTACSAGIYTSSILLPLCATLLESFGALHQLENYVSKNGRRFYGEEIDKVDLEKTKVTLKRVEGDEDGLIPFAYTHEKHLDLKDEDPEKITVMPFWAGKKLGWKIV